MTGETHESGAASWPSEYWQTASQPLTSLAFIAPWLVAYEWGLWHFGHSPHDQNAADYWMRTVLAGLGFTQYFLLPLLVVSALLAWHHLTRKPWRIHWAVLPVMLVECIVLALVLLATARLLGAIWDGWEAAALETAPWSAASGAARRLVGCVGAGVHEELLFRLILLPLTAGLLRLVGFSPVVSFAAAAVVSGLLFSAAHHLPGGEPFQAYRFTFRAIAGCLFAALFLLRGLGIAVGAHAVYDILVFGLSGSGD